MSARDRLLTDCRQQLLDSARANTLPDWNPEPPRLEAHADGTVSTSVRFEAWDRSDRRAEFRGDCTYRLKPDSSFERVDFSVHQQVLERVDTLTFSTSG